MEQHQTTPSPGARPGDRVSARFSDLSLNARIRAIALELFAKRGVEVTSMRTIAAAVGVSVGAIAYHFPAKRDLEAAVQRDVTEQILEAVHGVGEGLPLLDRLWARRRAWHQLLNRTPEINAYLGRVLTAGNEASIELAGLLAEGIRSEQAELAREGVVRPLDDPQAGLALYFALVNAFVFMQPFLGPVFQIEGSPAEVLERLQRAEVDLLTQPLYPGAGTAGS